MLTIYLIRHGQTQWNLAHKMQGSLNSDLTDLGQAQAVKLGDKLSEIKFDHIYCSDAPRAKQTAQLVFPNQLLQEAEGLREIAMGDWEGKTYDEIEAQDPIAWYQFFQAPFDYQPTAGGESFADLENRLREFVKSEKLAERTGTIALVSHRITLRMLLSILLADSELFSRIDLSPTSVSILDGMAAGYVVKQLNDTSHY